MAEFVAPGSALTEDLLAFLRSTDSPTVANAIETFDVRDRTEGFIGGKVEALFPDLGVMLGQALTVKVENKPGGVAGRAGYWQMWEALTKMPNPAVIVMQDSSRAPSRCAYAGEVMATLAQRLGVVGMVTDGGYRDVHEVRALGFHYYAAYKVVSHGNFEIIDVGAPVELDGATIRTGDILHGDANGIVIVPPEVLSGLPEAIRTIQDRERRFMEFIRSEGFSLDDAKAGTGY